MPERVAKGFTLVELVLTIMVIGIIAAVAALGLDRLVRGYADTMRAGDLSERADALYRFLAREFQGAVPRSLVVLSSSCVGFIPAAAVGQFRRQYEVSNNPLDPCYAPTANQCGNPLEMGALLNGTFPAPFDLAFDVVSNTRILWNYQDGVPNALLRPGWVVIGATATAGTSGSPWDGTRRYAIAPGALRWGQDVGGTARPQHGFAMVRLASPPIPQTNPGYLGSRFFFVDQNEAVVFYRCAGGALERQVLSGAGAFAGVPSPDPDDGSPGACPTSGWTTVASQVVACAFERITVNVEREAMRVSLTLHDPQYGSARTLVGTVGLWSEP
ncbi:MAG: type II secretion system GspH family protein [Hydrogenophilus sp.]|nr:type II secretion system GspH family protein [Hydrogenophilus sp.]